MKMVPAVSNDSCKDLDCLSTHSEMSFKLKSQSGLTLLCQSIPRGGGGVLRIFVYGDVHMEGKIQTQKHGFPENFAPKNIGILHISYPEIRVKIVF